MHNDLIIRGGIRIPSSAISGHVASGGAGGQHVNTTESGSNSVYVFRMHHHPSVRAHTIVQQSPLVHRPR